jgi:hypothetical protein
MSTIWAYALEIEVHTGAEVVHLYISTSPALVTGVGDTPPSTTFTTGLIQPGNYSIACFANGKTYGKASMGYGEIILNNDQGQFDYLLDYAFDGRAAILRRIDAALMTTADYPADWTTIYTGTLNSPLPNLPGYNQGTLTIPWRDRMVELQVPFPLSTFKGDNALPLGLEGTANDIASKGKPLILGRVLEIAPVCVNTARLIYAASPPIGGDLDLITDWDAIAAFDSVTSFFSTVLSGITSATVYDSGLEIVQEAVYTDENDMMTNAPTAGYCRILPAYGYIRFGSTPAGQVTVSCTSAIGTVHTVGNLLDTTLCHYLQWDAGRLNASDITSINALCTLSMGTFIQDTGVTVDQVLDRVAQSAGVCYYFDANGIFRAFQVRDPGTMTADFTLTDLQISSLSRMNKESIPAKAVRVKQQKCWTVQKSGLAGAVAADRRAWVSLDYRENLSHNLTTETKHLLAPTLEFETAFAVDAQAEADRLCNIYSMRRDFIEVVLIPELFDFTTLRLGMVGATNLSGRFGYTSKNMLLIGITCDLMNEKTTLTLWG